MEPEEPTDKNQWQMSLQNIRLHKALTDKDEDIKKLNLKGNPSPRMKIIKPQQINLKKINNQVIAYENQ